MHFKDFNASFFQDDIDAKLRIPGIVNDYMDIYVFKGICIVQDYIYMWKNYSDTSEELSWYV